MDVGQPNVAYFINVTSTFLEESSNYYTYVRFSSSLTVLGSVSLVKQGELGYFRQLVNLEHKQIIVIKE